TEPVRAARPTSAEYDKYRRKNKTMKTIIRKDEQAVSPVIATILMVAITVVLAAVLYVMVSGLISGPGSTPTAWGVNIARPGSQTNWTLTFTSIPQSATATSVFVTVSDANGAPLAIATHVAFSQIASGRSEERRVGYARTCQRVG